MRAGQALDARQRLGFDRAELGEVDGRDLGNARSGGGRGGGRAAAAAGRPSRPPGDAALLAGALHLGEIDVEFARERRTAGLACTWPKSAISDCGAAGTMGAAAICWASRGGSCCGSSEGGWLRAPSSLPFSRRMGILPRPCRRLSPASLRPCRRGDGTSIVALSDSSVSKGSSALTVSPGFTEILDDRNILEVADIGHFDFRGHDASLPC